MRTSLFASVLFRQSSSSQRIALYTRGAVLRLAVFIAFSSCFCSFSNTVWIDDQSLTFILFYMRMMRVRQCTAY